MLLEERINAFCKLGDFINQFIDNELNKKLINDTNDPFYEGLKHQIKLAEAHNGWFTKKNIIHALKGWSNLLKKKNLLNWLAPYNFNTINSQKVAIIMAGNIPLVGFHDFLSVLISGHSVIIKLSSNDKHLLPYLAKYLAHIAPLLKDKIIFTEKKLTGFDAIIATGSNNTARYFQYYFKNKPAIIRNNRNSVAILTGKETKNDLKALSEDVFRYYGLGCRSVSKLFVPKNYNFDSFFKSIYHWHPIINAPKYANNYDYNKAVYIMSEYSIIENGFLMIKEDQNYASPIATLFYEFYDNLDELKTKLTSYTKDIQCIVSKGFNEKEIAFGQTQNPQLWDYADNEDTIKFLLKI